ncbi:MAG: hypothetical protein Q4D51_09490 [Eubacteriales bacterium]|nr:hypothetical protein [Eubacteriales bacterium]
MIKGYIVYILLILFFIYLLVWSFRLHHYNKRLQKVKRIQELRAKGNEIKQRTIDCTKDYWYNLREVEDCKVGEDIEKYHHYFIGVDQGVKELLIEMYDCGIVRTDELEEIAYGKNRIHNVDLSFLEELEREMEAESEESLEDEEIAKEDEQKNEEDNVEDAEDAIEHTDAEENEQTEDAEKKHVDEKHQKSETKAKNEDTDDVIQVEGALGDFFGNNWGVVEAAKQLEKDDPGITDIHGTLSKGVENVIAAVDAEKKAKEHAEEPILKKKQKSIEELRMVRERTTTPEIRNKIYEKWVSYVFELYELVNINANEDTKHKIRKALMDYGYNDVDVLVECPEDI